MDEKPFCAASEETEDQTGPPGLAHDDPENSKRACWRVPALKTPLKFLEKTPRKSTSEMSGGRRKKKREILGFHPPFTPKPFGPPSGPLHFFWVKALPPPTLQDTTLLGPTLLAPLLLALIFSGFLIHLPPSSLFAAAFAAACAAFAFFSGRRPLNHHPCRFRPSKMSIMNFNN